MVLLGFKIKGEDKLYLESQLSHTQNVIWAGLQKKKNLKIKGTCNYYFRKVGYCFRTNVKSPLILTI